MVGEIEKKTIKHIFLARIYGGTRVSPKIITHWSPVFASSFVYRFNKI